jgi:hypothetical protein
VTTESSLTFSEQQLDHLAELLAIKLAAARPPARPMLTVEDICATFQVSRAWVYENAGRLGGVKLGPGQRAPLRFDAERVAAALTPLAAETPTASKPKHPSRKRPKHLHPVYDG